MKTIGIVGNPNCGKTTLFNGLTGSHQHIGNWPGVTVEKKEGLSKVATGDGGGERIRVVDLPGIYSLASTSEDEKVALDYILSHEADLYINVIDATTLERNLYLTLLMCELKVPMVVVVTMMDIVKQRNLRIDLERLAGRLGVPVIGVDATRGRDLRRLKGMLGDALAAARVPTVRLDYDRTLDDIELAGARYALIEGMLKDVVASVPHRAYLSEKVDRVVLNRFLGIPIFLGMMYLVFWFTQAVGGAFIDCLDGIGDTVFVSGLGWLMARIHAPEWLIAVVANGAGTAIQTVLTFLPPVGFMFLALSVLEDSGYMARAAFVMDRFMRWIGLPGKSFVPMLVGFGCSVPAIMATRTLESKRDRFLTVFMAPFMSCGAKLPIWVLFGAAFFPQNPGKLVFLIYVTGIVLGVATGLALKHTLFQGAPTHFIMELPPYHCPRPKHILLHAWERLKIFIWRAGKFIVPMVLVLGVLNTIGTDGSIGHEDSDESLLSVVGKAITPVFEPIGVESENWPASVAIFTGLFAKESVIGTMKGLYGQQDARAKGEEGAATDAEDGEYSVWGGIGGALATLAENLSAVFGRLADPLDLKGAEEEVEDEECAEETSAAVDSLRRHFPKGFHQVFSFLLFVLLYVPCLAATGVVYREIGKFYGTIFVGYLTVLGWSVATIYHAVAVSGSVIWLVVGCGLVAAMFGGFWAYGRKHRVDMI